MQERILHFEQRLREEGHEKFKRSCTYRSQEEQDALYMRGRCPLDAVNEAYKAVGLAPISASENYRPVTWRKVSNHTGREAVDYYQEIAGRASYDIKVDVDNDQIPDWKEFGAIAVECGLEWGGNWQKADYPHVEWRD